MMIILMNAMEMKMSDISKILSSICENLPDGDLTITDAEYYAWKERFDDLKEHEKVFEIVGSLSQYLTSGCRASASIFASALTCTARWCNEKDNEDFLNNM